MKMTRIDRATSPIRRAAALSTTLTTLATPFAGGCLVTGLSRGGGCCCGAFSGAGALFLGFALESSTLRFFLQPLLLAALLFLSATLGFFAALLFLRLNARLLFLANTLRFELGMRGQRLFGGSSFGASLLYILALHIGALAPDLNRHRTPGAALPGLDGANGLASERDLAGAFVPGAAHALQEIEQFLLLFFRNLGIGRVVRQAGLLHLLEQTLDRGSHLLCQLFDCHVRHHSSPFVARLLGRLEPRCTRRHDHRRRLLLGEFRSDFEEIRHGQFRQIFHGDHTLSCKAERQRAIHPVHAQQIFCGLYIIRSVSHGV
jgi:hypothetical protein